MALRCGSCLELITKFSESSVHEFLCSDRDVFPEDTVPQRFTLGFWTLWPGYQFDLCLRRSATAPGDYTSTKKVESK